MASLAGMNRSQPRVANVDVLRAVAALAVLVIHGYALGGRVAPIRAVYWYDVPLINLSSGVWLFFGISGYVITRPFVDRLVDGRPLPATVPYALRRGLRIFPLYWVALTAAIAIGGSAGTRGSSRSTIYCSTTSSPGARRRCSRRRGR
jgi:peptidoglycan/LPS O-acetylase OafA/YrhL